MARKKSPLVTLSSHDIRRIAVAAQCDPRTVKSTLNGTTKRPGAVAERVRRAAVKLGFAAYVAGLVAVAVWALVSCHSAQAAGGVAVWHDDARSVTCWITPGGISCLPDSSWGAR